MKKKKQKTKEQLSPMRRKISAMLTLQTFFVVLIVIVIATALALMYRVVITDMHMIGVLSMLVPIVVLVTLVNFLFTRYIYRYLDKISDAMQKVADGDYTVRLDAEKDQPFRELYRNFNTMAEELGGVEMLKNDFINGYAHELRTPITSINGFAEMLLNDDGTLSREEKRSYLEIIASESRRLADLAGNSLLMSRLDTQKIIPDKKPFSLDEQLRRCSILLSGQWMEKELDMTMDLDEAVYVGDYDLMQHLWINLLTNAVKYTPKGGSITVTLKNEEKFIAVSVADTGKGIPPEDRERIFDKYYQTDKSHSKRGLGLGLAICKRIVQLCNGSLTVESEVGVGSTFTVKLPK